MGSSHFSFRRRCGAVPAEVLSTQGLIVRPPKDQDDPVWEATVTTFPWVPDLVTFRYHLPGPGRVRRKLPARILCYRTRPRVPLPPMSGHVQQKTLYRRR
jgi:hypothetical protein